MLTRSHDNSFRFGGARMRGYFDCHAYQRLAISSRCSAQYFMSRLICVALVLVGQRLRYVGGHQRSRFSVDRRVAVMLAKFAWCLRADVAAARNFIASALCFAPFGTTSMSAAVRFWFHDMPTHGSVFCNAMQAPVPEHAERRLARGDQLLRLRAAAPPDNVGS